MCIHIHIHVYIYIYIYTHINKTYIYIYIYITHYTLHIMACRAARAPTAVFQARILLNPG